MHTDAHTRQILEWIGLSEGGLVDHPADPGGRTNKGITQRVYDAWRRLQGKPVRAVDHITNEEADEIIVRQYFDPVKASSLPKGLDYCVVDYAVNSGVGRAAKELQRALNKVRRSGLVVDGIVGVATLNAVRVTEATGNAGRVISEICRARLEFMQKIRHRSTGARLWDTFWRGWGRRVQAVERRSLALSARRAVPDEPDTDTPKAEDQGYRTWFQRLVWPDQ